MKLLAKTIIILGAIYFQLNLKQTPILLRGIVEGFYGTPWNFDIRADLIRFCGEYNLNAYIYAPKDDPYHRDKWREPYPEDKISELKGLVDISLENNVHFIFAVSPGLDLNYEGEKGEQDLQLMINKLDMMYNIGIRDFEIFFDDLEGEQSGKNQANFLNRLQDSLDKKYVDIFHLITVPTLYYIRSMLEEDGNINQYTKEFSKILNKKYIVLYTGDDIVSDGISEKSYQAVKDIYKRNLGIWWNYPVNDYYKNEKKRNIKLALSPIEKLPKNRVNPIFFNPMGQPLLSKIAIGTGADYAINTYKYNPIESWNRVIEKQFGELAPAMKVFASHSQHMEVFNLICGPADAPIFYEKAHQAVLDTKEGKNIDFIELDNLINEMEITAKTLLEKLPKNILKECKLMLEQFERIVIADKIASQSLKNKKLDSKLINIKKKIEKKESKEKISELSAVLFIDEVIELLK